MLRCARGQPGTDMSHITIPTGQVTFYSVLDCIRWDGVGLNCIL